MATSPEFSNGFNPEEYRRTIDALDKVETDEMMREQGVDAHVTDDDAVALVYSPFLQTDLDEMWLESQDPHFSELLSEEALRFLANPTEYMDKPAVEFPLSLDTN